MSLNIDCKLYNLHREAVLIYTRRILYIILFLVCPKNSASFNYFTGNSCLKFTGQTGIQSTVSRTNSKPSVRKLSLLPPFLGYSLTQGLYEVCKSEKYIVDKET